MRICKKLFLCYVLVAHSACATGKEKVRQPNPGSGTEKNITSNSIDSAEQKPATLAGQENTAEKTPYLKGATGKKNNLESLPNKSFSREKESREATIPAKKKEIEISPPAKSASITKDSPETCTKIHPEMRCVRVNGAPLHVDIQSPSVSDWLSCAKSKNCTYLKKESDITNKYKAKNHHRYCNWAGKRIPTSNEKNVLGKDIGFCVTELNFITHYPSFNLKKPLPDNPEPVGENVNSIQKIFGAEGTFDILDKPFCEHKYTSPAHCRDPVSYLKTNEQHNYLFKSHIKNLGGGYVGVGADANYTYIAHARSEYVWLMDFDPKINLLHKILKVFILDKETPVGLVKSFSAKNRKRSIRLLQAAFTNKEESEKAVALFQKSRAMLFDYYENQLYKVDGRRGFSWLAHKELYEYVRKLHKNGRIRILPGDLLKDKTLRFIGNSAKDMRIKIRLYYPSNAEEFWKYSDIYKKNIENLPFDDKSLVIRTVHEISWHRPKSKTKSYWHYIVQGAYMYQKRLLQSDYISLEDFRKHRIFHPTSEVLSFVDVPHSIPANVSHASTTQRQNIISGQ